MDGDERLQPYSDSELVLGLVAPAGTDLDSFEARIEAILAQFHYVVNRVRLSELAAEVMERPVPPGASEFARVDHLMDAGNNARQKYGGDILALAAAAKINNGRTRSNDGARAPLSRRAHLLRSLKHPGEVLALRRIYGPGFFLIGVLAEKEAREQHLRERRGCSAEEIDRLLQRDHHEGLDLGQRTRDTFHLADVFLPLDENHALRRFCDLVFGSPSTTPTADEYAMFMAFAAALRSADLSRQVGAVVATVNGDVVALGANDVPKATGGLYWPETGEHRDHVQGFDSNQELRRQIVDEILDRLRPESVNAEDWRTVGWSKLSGARVMDITEYGRAVHAEMEALLSCARSGVSPKDGTLFSTTFPCHNCAKHILAAGIARVVYVEPYPKSHAVNLYPNEIALGRSAGGSRVVFEPFQGVGPRRFFDLFSIDLSTGYPIKRKDKDGRVRVWHPASAELRVALLPTSYIVREEAAAAKLLTLKERGAT